MKKPVKLLLTALVCLLLLCSCAVQAELTPSLAPAETTQAPAETTPVPEETTQPSAEVPPEPALSFAGTYTKPDEVEVSITEAADGGYALNISIIRLTEIEATATEDGGILRFTGTDASGNPISGTFAPDGEQFALTFTDSTWEYLPNGTVFSGMEKTE